MDLVKDLREMFECENPLQEIVLFQRLTNQVQSDLRSGVPLDCARTAANSLYPERNGSDISGHGVSFWQGRYPRRP